MPRPRVNPNPCTDDIDGVEQLSAGERDNWRAVAWNLDHLWASVGTGGSGEPGPPGPPGSSVGSVRLVKLDAYIYGAVKSGVTIIPTPVTAPELIWDDTTLGFVETTDLTFMWCYPETIPVGLGRFRVGYVVPLITDATKLILLSPSCATFSL